MPAIFSFGVLRASVNVKPPASPDTAPIIYSVTRLLLILPLSLTALIVFIVLFFY